MLKEGQKIKVGFCDKTLWSRFLATLGIVSSLVTLLSFFVTAADIGINVLYIAIPFLFGIILLFFGMWFFANQRNHAELKINNTAVSVTVGDIWAPLKKDPKNRTGEISVIGVNDFFDVVVDDRIIASSSLHGQYINRMKQANEFDKLKRVIKNDPILNRPGNSEAVPSRTDGRKTRYKLGSMVEFEGYVLTAFTKFDDDNKAWLTAEEYACFWMRFWSNIDQIYAGRTINIPLMGAGITRFRNGKPSKQELLEVMLWSLKMSGFQNTYPGKRINFVINSEDAGEIDFYHIQHNPNYK